MVKNVVTFSAPNENGASKSQVLKRAWESESGHFGVASAPFEIDLSFLRFGVFCRLSSQILLVVKNVTAFSVLSQNGTSKSHVLKRNLACKSGHLGVASALFEIDLSFLPLGVFWRLKSQTLLIKNVATLFFGVNGLLFSILWCLSRLST